MGRQTDNSTKIVWIIIALVLAALVAVLLIHVPVSSDRGVGKKLDDIVHAHDGEDEYLGLGGRMTSEEMLDYMILKYTSGLDGTQGWEENPDPVPDPKPEPEPKPEPKPGTEPSGPDHPIKEEWKARIQEGVDNVETLFSVVVPVGTTEEEVLNTIFNEAKYHTAEHGIFLDAISWNTKGQEYNLWPNYPYSRDEILEIKEKTAVRENKIYPEVNLSDGLSDYEKIHRINEYVCNLVEYPDKQPYSAESHTAYGALFEKSAVCDGYSRLVKMLCDDAGLDSYIVVGYVIGGGGHAWNLVKVDGKWYHVDVTWNDGGADRSDFLLIPDSYLDGYRIWDHDFYPEVSTVPYNR